MKKYLALILSLIMVALSIAACGSSSMEERSDISVILDEINSGKSDAKAERETLSTVYLNSSRKGAITKAANPVIGIKFDNIESYYDITKTSTNFKVTPLDGSMNSFYVMCDSPDEVLIGDFRYGFATALSTKWEDLLHIYDFEKNVVYKVVTPRNTNKIKKIDDSKYAVRYTTDDNEIKTISFSTSDKYAYDLFASNQDVIMIVDGGSEYDVARELAQESEGATTTIIEESLTSTIEVTDDGNLVLVASDAGDVSVQNRTLTEPESSYDDSFEVKDEQSETVAPRMIQDTGVIERIEEPEAGISDDEFDAEGHNNNDEYNEKEPYEEVSEAESTEEYIEENISENHEDYIEEASSEEASDESYNMTDEGEAIEEEIETTEVIYNKNIDAAEQETYEAFEETQTEQIKTEVASTEVVSRHQDIAGGRIINAPVIAQFPYYPTGCESVSATMALQYSGLQISVDDFINLYLDKDNTFYIRDGIKYGPSPYEYFIGSPYDASGFGCMSNVIYKAFLKIYGDDRTKVVNASGISMNELCNDYINKDLPVLVWVNIGMTDAFDSNTWNLEDGTEFVWQGGEHCMLLVGYDAYNYYFNDPYTGKCISYGRDVSEKCYLQQGMQAIVIMD